MPIMIRKTISGRPFTNVAAAAMLAAFALSGCAPSELKNSNPKETATADSNGATATSGAAGDGNTTGSVTADDRTTGIIQFPEQPAPAGFKLPWPDALPATKLKEIGTRGGSITATTIGDPKTFDPLTNNESSSSQVIGQMFATLLGYDVDTQDYYPFLLKSLTVEADQKTWVAELRDGLKWSDGQPLTVDDVIFTAQVTFDPAIINPSADILQVNGKPLKFEKVDNLKFKVIADEPTGFMHVMLAGFTPLPKHTLEPAYKAGQFNSSMSVNIDPSKLVVSGPFKLQVYQPGERVVLVRNDQYFRVDKTGARLPYLDSLVFSIAPDLDSMTAKFRSGEADTLDSPRPEIVPDLRDAQAKEGFTLYDKGPGDTAAFFWFNLKSGTNAEGKPYVRPELAAVFADAQFRKAVYQAINREGMIRTVLRGLAVEANSMTPIALKDWYNPNLNKYNYDVEAAKSLLENAGYKDTNGDGVREMPNGQPLAFTFITNVENKTRIELSTIIATDLRAVGIAATPQSVDFNTLVTQLNDSFQYEACLLGFTGSIHPITSMNVWRSTGRTHYWNPLQKTPATPWEAEIDKLAMQFAVSLDFATQQKTFFEMQQILSDNLPTLPLYYPKAFSAIRNRFGNIRPTPFADSYWNADELFVKK